jgi:DHA1 family inner membrane transport protein
MLRLALAAYAAAHLVMAASESFGLLFASRLGAGAVHGAFIGVASVAAARLAGEGREGRAIAMVFGGVALSTVIGVPLGTLVGQTLGWRASFLSVAALGAIALALTVVLVPSIGSRGSGRTLDQARAAFSLPVLAMLAVGFLIIGGQFTTLTYLEPFLREVTEVSSGAVSAFLLAFGVATAAGAFLSGWAADRSAAGTLIAANSGLAAMAGALYVAGPVPLLTAVAVIGWGLVGFGLVSTALQVRVIGLAGCGGDLAASLGASAANAGIAVGALAGGLVIAELETRDVALVGALILLLALPATIAARSLTPRTATATDAAGTLEALAQS